jgi:hypothetical protein
VLITGEKDSEGHRKLRAETKETGRRATPSSRKALGSEFVQRVVGG